MPDLISAMKQIAAGVYDAKNPIALCYGTVVSTEPFQIRLDQQRTLGKSFFVVEDGVTAQSFEVGDVLILLRVEQGQKYLIFGKKGGL